MRSRNVRRGSRGTLIFRIVGGLCWLILLVVAIRVSGKLGESRQENEALRGRLDKVAEGAPANQEPSVADEVVDPAELAALKDELSMMTREMEQLQERALKEREQILRESAKDRDTLTTGIAKVLNQTGASREKLEALLAELPAEDRLRLLGQLKEREAAAPVGVEEPRTTEVEVIPPPDDEPEVGMPRKPAEGPGADSGEGEPEGEPASEEPVEADKPEFVTYTVKRGDTLSHIGKKFEVSVAEIMELNGIADARKLGIGQVLKIPRH